MWSLSLTAARRWVALCLLLLGWCVSCAVCDLYMHHPAGSTNRLNEATRQRANDNRVFDSQDNNRGGYPVPSTGRMYYYEGSLLYVEWTAQHACGGNPTDNCQFLLQYSCDNTNTMRDGNSTSTIPDPFNTAAGNNACQNGNCDTDVTYGRHESQAYYNLTRWTKRNAGLFLADQQLQGNSARYTRQNNNGQAHGYECAEERDYYPYWRAAPWKDIAVMTNQGSRCAAYQAESQNVKARYQCVISSLTAAQQQAASQGNPYIPITTSECVSAGGVWTMVPAFNIPAPQCVVLANSSRDNHLGNPSGSSGYTYSFNWTLPNDYSESCVLRMRYNISTSDFSLPTPAQLTSDATDGGFASSSSVQSGVDSTYNHQNAAQTTTGLPVDVLAGFATNNAQNPELADQSKAYTRGFSYRNNPYVDPFGPLLWKDPNTVPSAGSKVQQKLAINTAQFARTFQDRSFVFAIRQRPAALANARIHNLNVRGKRGNIVQVYPSVEYDFVPDQLLLTEGDMVHFQWGGGNTNPTNNDPTNTNQPLGSDRSNVVLLGQTVWAEAGQLSSGGAVGQWGRAQPCRIDNDLNCPFLGLSITDLQRLALNGINASYFDLGPRQVTRSGTYHYMSTRNNAFSNRSHKGKLVVLPLNSTQPASGNSAGSSAASVEWGLQCGALSSGMPAGTYVDAGQCSGQLVTSQDVYLSSGGSSSYDSEWYQLQPQQLTLQSPLLVTLPYRYLPLNQPHVYWKANATALTLLRVGGESQSGSSVTFAANAGGYYVVQNSVNAGEVAGIVLAGALLLAVCGFLYWKVRVQPYGGVEEWMRQCFLCRRTHAPLSRGKDDEQARHQLMSHAAAPAVSTAV